MHIGQPSKQEYTKPDGTKCSVEWKVSQDGWEKELIRIVQPARDSPNHYGFWSFDIGDLKAFIKSLLADKDKEWQDWYDKTIKMLNDCVDEDKIQLKVIADQLNMMKFTLLDKYKGDK